MTMIVDMETVFGVLAGATPLLVAWISRRPRVKMLEKQSTDPTRFAGVAVTGGSVVSALMAQRLKDLGCLMGRVVVEWSDGKMTDLPKMIVQELLAFGPSGATVIR